jgi:uncharacterized membrane protein YfhO
MHIVQTSLFCNLKKSFPFVFLISILILYFFPVLFEEKTFFYRDIQHFAYPMKFYLTQIWALGEWPFWYPHLLQGIPIMPLMHPGVFYPPSILFLIEDFFLAFHAYFLFHHLILMGSVFALCQYWGKSIQASLCASITSLLGGYFLALAAVYNQFHSAVWFPLILMMWQKYLAKGSLKFFCGAAIFISFQVLGGGAENAIFSILLIYAYSFYLAEENGFIRKNMVVVALVLMALALSALQWIPTYYYLQDTPRGSGLDFATSTQWSLKPSTLMSLFLPENNTGFMEATEGTMDYFIHSFYMGVVPLFVFINCIFVYREQKEIRFWLAVFGVGIFFSLGEYNPLYSLFHEWVPIFDMFRYPQKFFFLCGFALVFLLGLSLDRIVEGLNSNKNEIKKLLLALFITSVGVAAIFGIHANRNGLETLMILLLLALAIFALHYKKITQVKFLNFLLLLIVMDLMGKNAMVIPMIDKKFYTEPPALAQRLGGTANSFRIYSGNIMEGKSNISKPNQSESEVISPPTKKLFYNSLAFHLTTRNQLSPNIGAIYDLAYVNGNATMPTKSAYSWHKSFVASEIERKKLILKRSNVKFWVTDDYEQPPSEINLGEIKKVEEFENALPRAFLVGDSITMPEEKLLNFYFDSRFDPLKQVLLTELVPVKKTENFFGQVEELSYPPNGVNIKTSQNGEGFLVLLDTFFPGWQVTVDGTQQPIYRANSFYRAVKLGPGNHSIEFSYVPVGLEIGIYISSFALIFIVLFVFKRTRIGQ